MNIFNARTLLQSASLGFGLIVSMSAHSAVINVDYDASGVSLVATGSGELNILAGGTIGGGGSIDSSSANLYDGGRVDGNFNVLDASTFNMYGGAVGGTLTVKEDAHANVHAGTIATIYVDGDPTGISNPQANVYGGVFGYVEGRYDGGVINFHGGDSSHLSARDGGTVNMNGGTLGVARLSGHSAPGWAATTLNIVGGAMDFILGHGYEGADAIANVTGGTVNSAVNMQDYSTLNVSGGVVPRVNLYGNSVANLYSMENEVATLALYSVDAIFNIFGYGFEYDNGVLTGYWQNGNQFTHNVAYASSLGLDSSVLVSNYVLHDVSTVPEAPTLALMLAGALPFMFAARARRRQQRLGLQSAVA